MSHPAYPNAADLSTLLKEVGIDTVSSQRLDTIMRQAVSQFEAQTGYCPFLGASATRVFDPPGGNGNYIGSPRGGHRILTLDTGLISLSSLTVGGTTYHVGTDFWLRPNNRTANWIEFSQPIYGAPQCISITGTWGYSTSVPDDAWLAILRMAGLICITEYVAKSTGGVQEWAEGGASEKYGNAPFASVSEDWRDYITLVVNSYKRVTVGL